jgi:excisionase family DNA binding protein
MPKKSVKPTQSALRAESDDDVIGLEEAVAFLKTTKPTMYRWIGQGRLQGFKAGRQWRFYRRDLRKFLEYDDPAALNIDLGAVREAIKLLEARIAKVEKVSRKGARR